MNENKNIILYIGKVALDTIPNLQKWSKKENKSIRIAILYDTRKQKKANIEIPKEVAIILSCDFSSETAIQKTLLPYQEELLAVTARGDNNIPYLRKVIPHVPYMRTPTSASLNWSLNKIMMRQQFEIYDKSITPDFMVVHDAKKKTLKEIETKVGFPLVVKPAQLESSILVTVCYHQEELEKTLKLTVRKIKTLYKQKGRIIEPKILVEQLMEGEMYSVDAYIDSRGNVYFCPLVHVKTGRSIGFDDFFGYQRITPTTLGKEAIQNAEQVSTTALHALGLRSTSAHIELIKTNTGWKVIEIGPRLGGYRHLMYSKSFDINHIANDIKIRIPEKPIIPKKILGYTSVLLHYAKKEGTLTKLTGIKKIQDLLSFESVKINKKIGTFCRYAKNGGDCVVTVTLFNKDRSKLLADIRRMEQTLIIETS